MHYVNSDNTCMCKCMHTAFVLSQIWYTFYTRVQIHTYINSYLHDAVVSFLVWLWVMCLILDLHTAGKHMEDSFVAAYTAVLIGSIIEHDMVSILPYFILS